MFLDYATLKLVHVTLVGFSIGLHFVRIYALLLKPVHLKHPAIKILPHAVDTGLIVTALVLLQYFATIPNWIKVKIFLLAIYIVSGFLAFHESRSQLRRLGLVVMSLGSLAAVVTIAFLKPAFD